MAPKPRPRLTDAEKMEKARANTRRAALRELLYGVILSRLWPSWLHLTDNDDYPMIMVVDSPAGRLTWRIAVDETAAVEHLEQRGKTTQKAVDRMPILQALSEGW